MMGGNFTVVMLIAVLNGSTVKLIPLGADNQYLTDLFKVGELKDKVVAAILRSSTGAEESSLNRQTYRSGKLYIDLKKTKVTNNGSTIQLTPQEWSLLRVLVKYTGVVVSSSQLLQEAWGPYYGNEGDYIRTYILRLRKKLEPNPQTPCYILLERGQGYRLAEPKG